MISSEDNIKYYTDHYYLGDHPKREMSIYKAVWVGELRWYYWDFYYDKWQNTANIWLPKNKYEHFKQVSEEEVERILALERIS